MADTLEQITALNRKRGSIKSRLTLFKKYLQTLAELLDLSPAQVIELEMKTNRYEAIITDFDEVQINLEMIADDVEAQYLERENFESEYYSELAKAKEMLNKEKTGSVYEASVHSGQTPSEVDTNDNASSSDGSSPNSHPSSFKIKLPDIPLQKFDGNYQNWLEFRDTFYALIHTNESIKPIQKFYYLRASLIDAAAQVIKSLEFSEINYEIAWESLKERYNNERLLIGNHVNAIFELPAITKESSERLRCLSDDISKHLRALKLLGEPIESWGTLIIRIISGKLPSITIKEWEESRADKKVQSFEEFKTFLKNRADFLESYEFNSVSVTVPTGYQGKQDNSKNVRQKTHSRGFYTKTGQRCVNCKGDHIIYTCADFLKLSVTDRAKLVKSLRICVNCLHPGHSGTNCKYGSCRKCYLKHHTLLHVDKDAASQSNENAIDNANVLTARDTIANSHSVSGSVNGLLSTILVKVFDSSGGAYYARAILDSGSESCFITKELANKLNLPKNEVNLRISCLANTASNSYSTCSILLQSIHNEFQANITCFVIDVITTSVPGFTIDPSQLNIPPNIRLADPEFEQNGKVDILIGAELFWELLSIGRISLGQNNPILQKTRFGWILAGKRPSSIVQATTRCNLAKYVNESRIHDQLTQFWKIEECSIAQPQSREEHNCERHFKENVQRNEKGQFVVSLPFKESPALLGDSRAIAEKRFGFLEKRLAKNSLLRDSYIKFLTEYENLGHMTEIKNLDSINSGINRYYMPHHGVVREDKTTTKLRVVFDASATTTTGKSLNELQMTGPIIQDDLLSIILRFRKHPIVISADIEKMYRMIQVNPNQRHLQCILWRSDPTKKLRTFELNTVTYGTTAASFLAIRCLHELANECESSNPLASKIIKSDFYVDDLLTGANTVSEAAKIGQDIFDILCKAGLVLKKWRSNRREAIERTCEYNSTELIDFGSNENSKTLGLAWSSINDILMYKINTNPSENTVSKRVILSCISQIFDPLGLLGPCIILAKIMLQELWSEKLTWDESLPAVLHSKWLQFRNNLECLNKLSIPRHVICNNFVVLEMHGFSDASESAYGACIYIRSTNSNGEVSVNLLCAKSKVAPLKSLTIPRLELCGALLLSRLSNKVLKSLELKFNQITLWTDSTIVLGWLKTPVNLLKVFVNNRVAEIQESTSEFSWRHIATKYNPADLISRGLSPHALQGAKIWWHGPPWLQNPATEWPITFNQNENSLPELRSTAFCSANHSEIFVRFERFSNLNRLKRHFAYVLRFTKNCQLKASERQAGPLSVHEIQTSFRLLIKIAQENEFDMELRNLRAAKSVSNKSKLSTLYPFLDEYGVIRVGGRLRNSAFTYEKKHPIILSANHRLTHLIFASEHLRLMHAGPQLLLASIRDVFWPIGGLRLAKSIYRKCVKCFRFNSKGVSPIMGNLPSARVQSSFPFFHTGVDYGGPFILKDRKGRGSKSSKCWMSLFICFTTRAIHLELVTDLTTEAFVMALRRFVARRGKPAHIYSDNGTTFVGANSEIQNLYSFLKGSEYDISSSLTRDEITWHFIPAHSPHFGGLWEAGIKSCKHHLKRVLGNSHLTYEEFSTLLSQIEAILNSRPLSSMSTDPNDFNPLTPAHFLVGRNLSSVPEHDLKPLKEARLNVYQRLQQLQQHFWERWNKEYVSELQQRRRWKQTQGDLKLNTLVLIKEDNLPPLKWRLGRIVLLHPGEDGVSRVASVKTVSGTFRRAFFKLCPLPIDDCLERQGFQGGVHVS